MDRTDKRALVLALVDALRSSGSWCGETHIQKSLYILQTMLGLPTDFNFILYKHGPFSFDLQEYLHGLRGDDLIGSAPNTFQYGTSVVVTPAGKQIESLRTDLINRHSGQLQEVSDLLGKKTVRDLEKVATAVYVTRELGEGSTVTDRATRLMQYKKHVLQAEAEQAISEADKLIQQFVAS